MEEWNGTSFLHTPRDLPSLHVASEATGFLGRMVGDVTSTPNYCEGTPPHFSGERHMALCMVEPLCGLALRQPGGGVMFTVKVEQTPNCDALTA